MIKLLVIVLSFISLYAAPSAKYNVINSGVTLGQISDFSTINKGYLVAKPTNGLLKLFISFENYVIHEKAKKPNIAGENKYKEDNHLLLNLIRELTDDQPAEKTIESKTHKLLIKCIDGKCTYKRINKKTDDSSSGYLNFLNNEFLELYDDSSGLSFKKIDE